MVNPAPPAGRFDGSLHRFPVRVYFEDTDLSGVVYHANYLRFMERARSDMLERVGIDQRAAYEAGDGAWVVTDIAMRFLSPARLGDAIIVESRTRRVRGTSVEIEQRIVRDRTRLIDARVTAAFASPTGRARRMPAGWADAFRTVIADEET